MSEEQRIDKYMTENVSPTLERLVAHLIHRKPDDPVPYMLHYLEKKKGIAAKPLTNDERIELTLLQIEEDKLKTKIKQKEEELKECEGEEEEEDQYDSDRHDASSEEEEEDFVDEIPQTLQQKVPKFRTSVSAEAFGIFNKKVEFKPRVIPKDDNTKEEIKERLTESFMFANLDDKEMKIVLDAMEVKKYQPGDEIIRQGDDGAELFLVGEGLLECYRVMQKGEEPIMLKKYGPGDAFGELALLYNAPRAATIKAATRSILYSLDRNTFNNIVKESSAKKRHKYEVTFKQVKILSNIENYERAKLADAVKERKYKEGETIIKEGEPGEEFFIVTEGNASAYKTIEGKEKKVMDYEVGSYFGEISLLKNEPRAATVIADTDLIVVYLNRKMFKSLLGPLEEILKRNMEVYSQFS